ncbi:hypothetical protein GGF32_005329, partial [Allomyces javanicus]
MIPTRASTELSRVDAGIAHLSQIVHLLVPSNDAAPSPLRSLNLHGNRLVRLEPASLLARLACLTALDVSSNDLVDMAAVASLPMLRVLNLANNRLTTIQGLDALVHLEKLVLAYNAISSLVGLVHIHGAGYALKTLDMRGNRIADVPELYYLSGLV